MNEEQQEFLKTIKKDLNDIYINLGSLVDDIYGLDNKFQESCLNETNQPDVPEYDDMLEYIQEFQSKIDDAMNAGETAIDYIGTVK